MTAADYQQVQSYLSPESEYGRLAFVVTRDDSVDLYAHRDVEWVRDMHAQHKVLIVKLTARFFVKLLHKLRNPQKHDAVDDSIHKLLDTYTRLYLAGQTVPHNGEKRLSRKKRRKLEAARAKAAKSAQPNQTTSQAPGSAST